MEINLESIPDYVLITLLRHGDKNKLIQKILNDKKIHKDNLQGILRYIQLNRL